MTNSILDDNFILPYCNDPNLVEEHHNSFGIGFAEGIDWLRFTWDNRIVRDAGPYNKVGYAWQHLLDWSLLNFPRLYHQLARGHDKTERESWWMLVWGLTAEAGQCFCCGVDRDNARLYRDAAKWIVANHGDIFADYEIHNYDIIHKRNGTEIRILASDEGSNYGLTPDLLLVTDFHAWTNKEFWDALWTAMGKRQSSRVWIESNALALGTEQVQWIRPIREYAKRRYDEHDPRWFYYAPPTFLAPWQSHALAEWAETLLPQSFRRLICNQDTTDANTYLTAEQVESCERKKGPSKPYPGSNVIITTDLGLTTDAAVVTCVSEYTHDGIQIIDLNEIAIFTGSKDKPVNIDQVVNTANAWEKQYKARKYCDPYEMRHVMQQDSSWTEYPFNSKNLSSLTKKLWRTVVSKRLVIWPNCAPAMQAKGSARESRWDLKRELTEAILKNMSYGERVDHKANGFSDRLIALGMAVDLLYQDYLPKPPEPEPIKIDGQIDGKIIDEVCGLPTSRTERII